MQRVILIKHSAPQVEPEIPSDQWHLSETGRALCGPLAERVRAVAPSRIVSSVEPKAVETAEEVGRVLGLDTTTAQGLKEHDRSNVPHMRSRDFISMMELFFRRPDERVLGIESATEALQRVDAAVKRVMGDGKGVAIVTHGTVLALLLSKYNPSKRGFDLWRQMGLPSLAVVNGDLLIERLVERFSP